MQSSQASGGEDSAIAQAPPMHGRSEGGPTLASAAGVIKICTSDCSHQQQESGAFTILPEVMSEVPQSSVLHVP